MQQKVKQNDNNKYIKEDNGKVAERQNDNKIKLSLLPTVALREEAKVWQFGAKKYSRDNWKKLWGDKTINTCMDSLLRHAFSILEGEDIDNESGLYHAAHIRCNAAMILEYYDRLEKSNLPDKITISYQNSSNKHVVFTETRTINLDELEEYKKAYNNVEVLDD